MTDTTASYLVPATNERYAATAFAYIGSPLQTVAILETAQKLGISAGAIAGAMAEENQAYGQNKTLQDLLDQYALSGFLPNQLLLDIVLLPLAEALAKNAYNFVLTTRTHAEWVAGCFDEELSARSASASPTGSSFAAGCNHATRGNDSL